MSRHTSQHSDVAKARNDVSRSFPAPARLAAAFQSPPVTHGPVPFYWWAGEKLDRDRIAWQLDQLREKGVRQTIISYPHHPDGTNDPGDPQLFSPEWWELFRWFLAECRQRGMTAGFQDYTLVEPILKAIGRATPGMQGGQMSCDARRVSGNETVRLAAEPGTLVIHAWAYPVGNDRVDIDGRIALMEHTRDGVLEWTAPAGDWLVALVFARLNPFDPLHPDSGKLAIGELYVPFERECQEEIGKTLNLFFQDELDFGCRMPFWSNHLFDAFAELKGYDLGPLLPALWHDLGPVTEKVRIDFADVVTRRAEACYFEPVFRWHEERGILFGHDNCGRGRIAQGRSHYGDYFRTMRWYSAPGCDDPKLQGARSFKGLKVNSSIAHFYQRPRVWVEAFHSSGWGTTPSEVVAALNEDFAYGATVVNLHGLYYSTRGGWWEWAPPDFHFRQPYWKHSGALNEYFTRLSWLLSQGVHRCDVAIVYPVTALDAAPADPAINGVIAHVGNETSEGGECDNPQPEETAFALGKHLFDHACDFDFIDFESIAAADARSGELHAGPGRYRVLIIPAMAAVRFSTLEKARDFVRAGGLVIAFGRMPRASDRAGRGDPELDQLLEEIFGSTYDEEDLTHSHPGGGVACLIRKSHAKVREIINDVIERDVVSSVPLHVLHRHLDASEVYFVFNPAGTAVTANLAFRTNGNAREWNAWTGETTPLTPGDQQTLTLAPREAKLIVFSPSSDEDRPQSTRGVMADELVEELDGLWDLTLQPTLDNRFGDFSLPAGDEVLGPQARRFEYADELAGVEPSPEDWRETTFSFGQRLEATGPLPPSTDFAALEAGLLDGSAVLDWQPREFSLRWGIERDPFLTDWLSGPHGLKGHVPDEFLDFHSGTPGTTWYLRARVIAPQAGEYSLRAGARCVYQVWVNGASVLAQDQALPAGLYAPWNIPHYECDPREARIHLRQGTNDVLIKLVQPEGQRTRAFVVLDPPSATPATPALRWFTDPAVPRLGLPAPDSRDAIRFRFTSPPGARTMTFVARGPSQAWANGRECALTILESLTDGSRRYHAVIADPSPDSSLITLRVEAPIESRGGDALPEPVRFECGAGCIPSGDWCDHGLATYSGAATYSRNVEITAGKSRVLLDLGRVEATAEVRVNGKTAATLIAPPWTVDLTDFLIPGGNELSITVANTLANHYSVGIPTPYAFPSQTPSGLFGPVVLIHR